jgi:hypothetical protein
LFGADVTRVLHLIVMHAIKISEMLEAKMFWFISLKDKRATYHVIFALLEAVICLLLHSRNDSSLPQFQIPQHGGLDSVH